MPILREGRCQSDRTFQNIGLEDHGIYSIDDEGLYNGCHWIMEPWERIHRGRNCVKKRRAMDHVLPHEGQWPAVREGAKPMDMEGRLMVSGAHLPPMLVTLEV